MLLLVHWIDTVLSAHAHVAVPEAELVAIQLQVNVFVEAVSKANNAMKRFVLQTGLAAIVN